MYRRSPDFQETMDGIDPLRGTYHSADSNSSPLRASASSSKAVLAALRALQDKIKRLESERTQALDETANLRQQIKNQEMEADNFKRRDSLASQKKLHEVQSAYDRSVTEKTESEIRLSNLEERNRIEDEIARDLRAKIRAVEDEKHNGLLVIKDMESERTRLQSQILHVQHKEKGEHAFVIALFCTILHHNNLSHIRFGHHYQFQCMYIQDNYKYVSCDMFISYY